jgi:DNA-binding response OmpR family regulator
MRTQETDAPTSCKVLVIDDEPQIIELIILVLRRKYGDNIIGAVGSTEGLAKARESIPDLVILDIMMPDPDGYEVCKQLKGTLTLQDIPILFIASKPPQDVYPVARNLGASGYMTEPFGPLELLTACEALLRGEDLVGRQI